MKRRNFLTALIGAVSDGGPGEPLLRRLEPASDPNVVWVEQIHEYT